jgi:hypothetical protein
MAPIAVDTADTALSSTSGNPLMEADPINVLPTLICFIL